MNINEEIIISIITGISMNNISDFVFRLLQHVNKFLLLVYFSERKSFEIQNC